MEGIWVSVDALEKQKTNKNKLRRNSRGQQLSDDRRDVTAVWEFTAWSFRMCFTPPYCHSAIFTAAEENASCNVKEIQQLLGKRPFDYIFFVLFFLNQQMGHFHFPVFNMTLLRRCRTSSYHLRNRVLKIHCGDRNIYWTQEVRKRPYYCCSRVAIKLPIWNKNGVLG